MFWNTNWVYWKLYIGYVETHVISYSLTCAHFRGSKAIKLQKISSLGANHGGASWAWPPQYWRCSTLLTTLVLTQQLTSISRTLRLRIPNPCQFRKNCKAFGTNFFGPAQTTRHRLHEIIATGNAETEYKAFTRCMKKTVPFHIAEYSSVNSKIQLRHLNLTGVWLCECPGL